MFNQAPKLKFVFTNYKIFNVNSLCLYEIYMWKKIQVHPHIKV